MRNRRPSSPYFIPQPTWTHEVFPLTKANVCHTPKRPQITAMQKAGYGGRKITFQDKRSDPKIASQNGTFWLLQYLSGGSGIRDLTVIPMEVMATQYHCLKQHASHHQFTYYQYREI